MSNTRKRATAGIIIVAGIGLAFLLRGIGLQIGTSDESGIPSGSQSTIENKPGIVGDLTSEKPMQPETTGDPKKDPVLPPPQRNGADARYL